MTKQTEAMKLTDPHDHPEPHTMKWTQLEMDYINKRVEAAVRQAIEQAEQVKPVAYGMPDTQLGRGQRMMMVRLDKGQDGCTVPLYTAPPRQPWAGLTDEDKQIAFDDTQEGGGFWEFADAIEATLRKKNHG